MLEAGQPPDQGDAEAPSADREAGAADGRAEFLADVLAGLGRSPKSRRFLREVRQVRG